MQRLGSCRLHYQLAWDTNCPMLKKVKIYFGVTENTKRHTEITELIQQTDFPLRSPCLLCELCD